MNAVTKALFLDRDGVINIDRGYVYKASECIFIDGIFDLVRRARTAGFMTIIVTNQSGIGRGLYTEADFMEFMAWMCGKFSAAGAPIDDVLFCPHHPHAEIEEYRRNCPSRKPAPGMIIRALRRHALNAAQCIMIGDRDTDMQAARDAGIGRKFRLTPDPYEIVADSLDYQLINSLSVVKIEKP